VPVAGVEEFAVADPVARVEEFGSGPVVPSARPRMVLRSTPVSRAIARWLVPVASNVATVVRLFGFKTFTFHAPLRWSKGKGYVLPAGLLSEDRLPTAALNGQEVGDFARPTGFALPAPNHQACRVVHAVGTLPIERPSFSAQQHMQATVSIAPLLASQHGQPR
jgi:hypothetical protein